MSKNSGSGYYHSPWPGEDGSAQRLQTPNEGQGLNIPVDATPIVTKRRFLWDFGNMIILRDQGQVYLMRANYLKHRYLRMPSSSTVCVFR